MPAPPTSAPPVAGDATTVGEDAAAPAAVGGAVGRFTITGMLGTGGMGVVLRGHDPVLARPVAIKLLHAREGGGEVERARLVAEAQAMARVVHPNVVAVHDVGIADGRAFVAMELVDGVNLSAWLGAAPRPWRAIVDVFVAVGHGLAAVHAAGLVHRDVKPGNVLVGRDGRARLADFGLADASDNGPRAAAVGTPRYMAPEQRAGATLDARADQYAYCVALHEAVTDALPTDGAIDKRVPRPLRAILTRGLAHAPTQRWPDVATLVAALERARAPRRWGWLVAALAVAATLAITLALLARRSPAPTAPPPPSAPAIPALYVDASASPGGTGTAAAPFASITAAIAAADRGPPGPIDIHVAAGRYDAARETFPLIVRHGVSLIGAGRTATIIVGSGHHDHATAGGTALGAIDVAILAGDPVATARIASLTLLPGPPPAWGIYCDQGNAFPPAPELPFSLTLDDVELRGFDRAVVIGTSDRPAPSGCSAMVRRSHISATREGVFMVGAGFGSNAPNRVRAIIGGPTPADGNLFVGTRNPTRAGLNGYEWPTAVKAFDQSTPVRIQHNTFSDDDVGIELATYNPALEFDIADNRFTDLGMAGVELTGNTHLRTLTDNYFGDIHGGASARTFVDEVHPTCGPRLGVAAAICVQGHGADTLGPQIDRARGNTFAGNDVALYVTGTPFTAAAPRRFDFGTAADPGGNRFVCNSSLRTPPGRDVWFDVAGAGVTLPFVGNGWDHVTPTTTAADGTDALVAAGGPALDLADHHHHGLPCPAPHEP